MRHPAKIRIMVFGTFDILHKGHLNFFKQARKLSSKPYLIVSVARDVNVKKIKGNKPSLNEKKRLSLVKKTGLADKVVLGAPDDYISHIIRYKPQIIALGYDQRAYTQNLKYILKKRGLIVRIKRLKAFRPQIHKSSILKIYAKRNTSSGK